MLVIPPLVDLWQYGSQRCVITAPSDGPPFNVAQYDGERLILHVFLDHETAAAFAVDALRAVTQSDQLTDWSAPRRHPVSSE